MQKCYSNCAFAFNILLFFFSLLHFTLSFTLWSNSYLTLSFPPLISTALSPQLCHCQSPLLLKLSSIAIAIFFLCLMVLGFWSVVLMILISGFWSMVLMILISGFWWFWLVVLGFWWVGWWWWLGGLMMEAGLMIAAALFFLCLIVNDGWELCQEWIFYWINV